MSDLTPVHPLEVGVLEQTPDIDHFEGAGVLANESRPKLREAGFTDEEIDEWARTYIALAKSGDVESFLSWVREKEGNFDGS